MVAADHAQPQQRAAQRGVCAQVGHEVS
jgi:hypothetical protein